MKGLLVCVVAAAVAALAASICPYQAISARHTICMYRTAACPGKALISQYTLLFSISIHYLLKLFNFALCIIYLFV